MNQITNPHDKFFKEVFTRRDTAVEFFLNYLPEDVVRLLNLDSLEYAKGSFIDKHLAEYSSDLLFKVSLRDGSEGYVYILFEHKSYQEPLTAFHLLRYMVKIWEMWLKLKEEEKPGLPVIIPLVLYHKEQSWQGGLNFRDLFASSEEMISFIPDFQYLLWDASGYNDEEIKGKAILRATLLLLKYVFRKDLIDRLPEILGLLRDLCEKRTGLEYLETILRYIVNAVTKDEINYEDLKAAVDKALPGKGGDIMTTIADVLREEGKQEGMQRGMQRGRHEELARMVREALLEKWGREMESLLSSADKASVDILERVLLRIVRGDQDGARALLKAN
ncbi:MAG: Rpn family recombination-promoting nuclease/putative transposase [bacterium]|nr:Rpn family recombination-promoting nuclease/putative transposase [bacterium]